MNFAEVYADLSPLGWRRIDETLFSPSGDFWFPRERLESGVLAVYAPAARRVHCSGSLSTENRRALVDLLRVLAVDPAIAALLAHLAEIEEALAETAAHHELTLSRWDFGRPNVRATARHPIAGVAVIECSSNGPPDCEVHAWHWVDEPGPVRRTRDARFARRMNDIDRVPEAAEEAVRHLLATTRPEGFTARPGLGDGDGSDVRYWSRFGVLR